MRGLINGRWVRRIQGDDEVPVFGRCAFRGAVPSQRHPAAAGRYHLYVSYACPFAHLTLLTRHLKGLEEAVGISVCDPYLGGPHGWFFARPDAPSAYEGVTVDRVNGLDYLHQVYTLAAPKCSGRVTVPVLWDMEAGTIVSNDSAEIVEILNTGLGSLGRRDVDLDPPSLKPESGELAQWIRDRVNAGVYRAGTAASQAAYDRAVTRLFDALDDMEARLADDGPYLFGDAPTLCDLRLFVTLIRLETGYAGALYCNLKRLTDYPALYAHTERLYRLERIAETVKFDHYLRHYYDDDVFVNRRRTGDEHFIVPAGPIPFTNVRP